MRLSAASVCTILAIGIVCASGAADPSPAPAETFRILSWNIAGDAFVAEQSGFRSLLRWGDPDVVLLDEVSPTADPAELAKALAGLRSGDDRPWNIDVGASGGRQRCVIASRAPQEELPELSSIVPYPEADQRSILEKMPRRERSRAPWSMDGGIPVNGTLILIGGRRLLVLVVDLQCCGVPSGWQEFRRRVEVREIRRVVRRILERTTVDGIVVAGDLNLVASSFPLAILTGPYPSPHSGLIPVELYHPDGTTAWTWDGRGTRFPSRTMDYQLYDPDVISVRSGLVLDTESLSPEVLERYGLEEGTSRRASDHRPLVVEYGWN